ncbi:MAG: MarR family transcriptional regulator [Actinobacteria bacterium]|nr:MarR family transcriptional regulator [Actinomycetota bacterium]
MTAQREPRWLDDVEREAWLGLIGVTIRLPAALDAQLQRDADLSHFEYQVLAGLSMTPGGQIRMSALARFANVTLSHLSRVATRLERRGLLERRPDPDDGRSTLAVLTPAGRDLVEQAAPEHVETVRRHVFDRLTRTQVRQLRSICGAVLGGLGPDASLPF